MTITEGMILRQTGVISLIGFLSVLTIVAFCTNFITTVKAKLIIRYGLYYLVLWLLCVGIIKIR